jgi:hypothetical protein
MGSGEIAPTMVATHRRGMERAGTKSVAVIDSPFGFQENVEQLTEKLIEFFQVSLVADTKVATLRTPQAPAAERERFLETIRASRYVFAGPGSPTYAMKVWSELDVAGTFGQVVRSGGTVCLASAAALTAGTKTIPVYEMYKVGEDPFWVDGLDLLGRLGLAVNVVPHWNNAEGGNHDTSRCYVGERRLRQMEKDLESGIIGVDEHTAATLDFEDRTLTVSGKGSVTLRGDTDTVIENGATLDFETVADLTGGVVRHEDTDVAPPVDLGDVSEALASGDADLVLERLLALEDESRENRSSQAELRRALVQVTDAARAGLGDPRERVAPFVDLLLDLRAGARAERRFAESDRIRDALVDLGVEVRDTPDGVEWDLM